MRYGGNEVKQPGTDFGVKSISDQRLFLDMAARQRLSWSGTGNRHGYRSNPHATSPTPISPTVPLIKHPTRPVKIADLFRLFARAA